MIIFGIAIWFLAIINWQFDKLHNYEAEGETDDQIIWLPTMYVCNTTRHNSYLVVQFDQWTQHHEICCHNNASFYIICILFSC